MYNRELYIPRISIIASIKKLTPDTKLFRVVFKERYPELSDEHEFLPGQFVQVSVFGVGEVPISIASSPTEKGYLDLSIRRVGFVTDVLHRLMPGNEIGIRGPYGNRYPIGNGQHKHLLFVGGGCGLAPLRSLMRYMISDRNKYSKLTILHGARTSDDILFKDELYSWRESKEVDVNLSVDRGPADPGCDIGLITTLFKRFDDLKDSMAFICGPPRMIYFTVKELMDLNLREEDIILSLERYMKCGVGKCGHCYIKDKYVCTDGPIFSYKQLKELRAEF